MSSPEVIYAWDRLIRDTFRQSMANYVFWVMLAASAVVIFFCLSVSIQGGQSLDLPDGVGIKRSPVRPQAMVAASIVGAMASPMGNGPYIAAGTRLFDAKPHGRVSLAFGAWSWDIPRDGPAEVRLILMLLAEWVAGLGGTLLALVWTAGFIPEFLQPANATVLLSKPVSRWVLLLGKYMGVLAFVGFQVTVFILGTWLALGLRTGFWDYHYLLGIPLLILQFAALYSFSVFLAVWTRSTLACVFGSIGFWFMCWGMNYGRHWLLALKTVLPPLHPVLGGLVEACYWVLPKPVDLSMLLYDALKAEDYFSSVADLQKALPQGAFNPYLSLLASLLFAAGMIVVAARQLSATDY